MISELIDQIECESFETIMLLLVQTAKVPSQILASSPIKPTVFPNCFYDFTDDLMKFLSVEAHLTTRDCKDALTAINQVRKYADEADLVYTIVGQSLEDRVQDNYRESLYKDSHQLIQLRQEKAFILRLLVLQLCNEVVEPSEAFRLLADSIAKKVKATMAIKFASLRASNTEVLEKGLLLLEEIKESQKPRKISSIGRSQMLASTARSQMMSPTHLQSLNNTEATTSRQSSVLRWFVLKLQTNQTSCREVFPNLRNIIRKFYKRLSTTNKNVSPHSFQFRDHLRFGSKRVKRGFAELPSMGPLDSINGLSLRKSLKQYVSETSIRSLDMVVVQLDSYLQGELLEELTGERLSFAETSRSSICSKASEVSSSRFETFSLDC